MHPVHRVKAAQRNRFRGPWLGFALAAVASGLLACGDGKSKRVFADGGDDASDDGSAIMSMPDAAVPYEPSDECNYLDLDIFIVSCDGEYRYARRWVSIAEESDGGTDDGGVSEDCPPFYSIDGGGKFLSLPTTLLSEMCDADCARFASTSVSLIRCDVRTGYIVYVDPENDCGDVYETEDGNFPSIEAWDEAAPCE